MCNDRFRDVIPNFVKPNLYANPCNFEPSLMSVNVIGHQYRKRNSYDEMNYGPNLPYWVVISTSGCVQTYAKQDRK